eukprot:scaffold8637_cov153-Skeletonema_dohrnii-CCMP3373.AAC.10
MNLNQATVAAFLSSATIASSAAFSHDEVKDKIAPLLASKHLNLSRVLQLNDGDDLLECIADTKELDSVTDVECLEGLTQEGNTFILDNSVCDPEYTNSITEACAAANGIIVSGYGDIDVTADCSIQGISQAFNILVKDTPQCMANSCDVSKWDIVKDKIFVEYSEIIKTEFSNLMAMAQPGVECKVTLNVSGGSPTPAPKDDDSSAGKATANLSGGSPTPAPKDDDSSAGKATAMLAFAATSAAAAFFFF